MLPLVVLTVLLTLLILAAITDLRERRIPNRLNGAVVGLYPVYVLVAPVAIAWPPALALALVVMLFGLVLFARDLIGGGDVKLIAAVSLWAGPDQLMPFLLVTTLTGGALCLITLWFQRWGLMVQAYLATLGVAMPTGGAPRLPEGAADPSAAPTTLPYGVAIAAGGIAVIIELLKL